MLEIKQAFTGYFRFFFQRKRKCEPPKCRTVIRPEISEVPEEPEQPTDEVHGEVQPKCVHQARTGIGKKQEVQRNR